MPGEARVESRFVIRGIALEIAEMPGFPALFHLVVCRVEHEAVRVEVRVGLAVHRTRRHVDELGPNHIAGDALFLRASNPDTCLHLGFHLSHRVTYRFAKGGHDPLVCRVRVHGRHGFRAVER